MTPDIVRIDAIHTPYAITNDRPSFRKPCIVRVIWKPTEAEARRLIPDWCDGATAVAHRDHTGTAKTTRWHVRATTYGFRDVELETVAAGESMEIEPIPPPKTRTRGRWFTWECGEWKEQSQYGWSQPYTEHYRKEYWHTPPWQPGESMTPRPPTDPVHAAQKAKP